MASLFDNMLGTKVIKTQTARRKFWVNILLSLFVASFALMFIPMSYKQSIIWFVGLFVTSYIAIYYATGFSSRIIVDKTSKYTISIPDHASNTSWQIPLECITHIEMCEYRWFKRDDYYPQGVSADYYYQKTMLGYTGKGLIITYRLAKMAIGDPIVRGVRIPAPKAKEFVSFVKKIKGRSL